MESLCPLSARMSTAKGKLMDLQNVLTHIESLSVDDRLRLIDRIWDGLLHQETDRELTEEQTAEIGRRLAEDDAAPDDVVSWDEVRSSS